MDIPLKIPVKQHIYRFLIANYGVSYRICTNDAIGIVLYNLLKNTSISAEDEQRISDYPHSYTILIPENYFFRYGVNSPCPTAVIQFNNFFDSIMKFAFLIHVESLMAPKPKDLTDIYNLFIDRFYYDEQTQTYEQFERIFGTMKKYHYRFRKRKQKLTLSLF